VPVFVTHTEGGSWNGGGTEVADCSAAQQRRILDAFDDFIDDPCLDCFPGLEDCLRESFETVNIDCDGSPCGDDGVFGCAQGNTMWIVTTDPVDLPPTVLHEMVHICGGSEFDAYAVENSCFFGNGAITPSTDLFDSFIGQTDALDGDDEVRVGKWAIWDMNTGEIFGKVEEGGSWNSSPEISKGPRCFQRDSWIFSPSEGGGW
jgi:hypothetical protein